MWASAPTGCLGRAANGRPYGATNPGFAALTERKARRSLRRALTRYIFSGNSFSTASRAAACSARFLLVPEPIPTG